MPTKPIPQTMTTRPAALWRAVLLLSLLAWGLVMWQAGGLLQQGGWLTTSLRWRTAAFGALALEVVLLALLLVAFTPLFRSVQQAAQAGFGVLLRLRFVNWLLMAAWAGLFAFAIENPRGFLFASLGARLGLLWTLAVPAGVFLRAALIHTARPQSSVEIVQSERQNALDWAAAFVAAMIAIGVVYKISGFLPDVSTYPLSLGWSESSRFYYASLFFSERLYGLDLAWPFLHPSRYLLQSLPFLAPGLPLVAHRLWQVMLWVGMTALVAALLARRAGPSSRWQRWMLAGWAFLFMFQGPVYYHLLVCVAIMLAFFRPRQPWLALAAVIGASAWAGISRVNWFPLPAFLAIMIYLLETPYASQRSLWRYARLPVVWAAVGGLSAFAAQAAYIFLSGSQDVKSFGSSFTSDLLWYRLWPSATYPPGILPMIVTLTLPLLLVIGWLSLRLRLHPLRLTGLAAMTLVMLAGGLVVSTKIGGGSNLHNLDAYLVLLLVWATWLAFGKAASELPAASRPVGPRWGVAGLPLLLLVILMPLYPLLREGGPFEVRQTQSAWEDVGEIQRRVDEVTARGGRVLFISQRHLLTFDMVTSVPLEPRYETVELMEMAMSGNSEYLDQFYDDLRTHRFDLIVTGQVNVVNQGAQDSFPEENNVWVERVAIPLLDNYEASATMEHSLIQLLVPKP